MDRKQKLKIVKILWIITSIIILVTATLLLIYGDTYDRAVGIVGYVLLIVEVVLFRKGKFIR